MRILLALILLVFTVNVAEAKWVYKYHTRTGPATVSPHPYHNGFEVVRPQPHERVVDFLIKEWVWVEDEEKPQPKRPKVEEDKDIDKLIIEYLRKKGYSINKIEQPH